MTPEQALQAIEALDKFGINLGLERIRACLGGLGEPQGRYPCVQVGGTNGKGSTAVLIAEALTAAGYRTGLYTSPPLEEFGERIRVDGVCLERAQVPALFEAVCRVRDRDPSLAGMTQFEVITAMAFLHFAREAVDAAVVEVGLGGRLDSTNVVVPEVAVVTNVGLEHAEHLGPTVAAIAREKAGILKSGVPLISAADGEARQVLEEEARRLGSRARWWGEDFEARRAAPGRFDYRGVAWRLADLEVALAGAYQRFNVGSAAAALEVLAERGWAVTEAAVRGGFARARWPGRFELLPGRPRILLDGAHNPPAARALVESLRSEVRYARLHLVIGILGDKDARSILADLVPLAATAILTCSRSQRAKGPAELAELAPRLAATRTEHAATVAGAVERALELAGDDDLVCVTGSLTTVAEARAHLRAGGRLG